MRRLPLALLAALPGAPPAAVTAQTLADVPGTVVYWRSSPASRYWPAADRIYTTSPAIAVLPGGDYLLAFNLFGGSLEPSASVSGTTYLYRSGDKGKSWVNLTPSPMMDMKRGSLFVHGDTVWIWGYTADGGGDSTSGSVIIRRSTDNGQTWTRPTQPNDPSNGYILAGSMGGTPFNPVIHNGRLWMAQGGKRIMSVSTAANWLLASAWSRSKAANTDSGPYGIPDSYKDVIITEAQIVASPQTGVVVLPKVESQPRTVLIRATGSSTVANPGTDDWVDLPGGGKKFGAGYDPVSQRFYVVSNPVLRAHFGHSEPWNMIRNTAALMSSEDLKHWDVQQIFLYSPNIDYEGFQYLNFAIDGDDMVIASRTAFDLTGEPGVDYRPPRGHDSNLITFHRIAGFRAALPDHYLAVSGGVVQRFERTQHRPAPLGPFVMGSHFDGVPLGAVDGLASANGEVLVREQGGRILRFDPLGNFLGTGSADGVNFLTQTDVAQPPPGERGWSMDGGGDWDDLYNWHYWNRADTAHETANFGSAISADATVTLNRARTVHGLRFRSASGYTLAGGGTLLLSGADSPAVLEAVAGAHNVDLPLRLGADAGLTAAVGAALRLRGGLDLGGRTLRVHGSGTVAVGSALNFNGGRLLIEGNASLGLLAGATAQLGGTIEWRPDPATVFRAGDAFTLLPGLVAVTGAFTAVILPDPSPGLLWDTTVLQTTGTVSLVADPGLVPLALMLLQPQPPILQVHGPAGRNYTLQSSADLQNWADRATFSAPAMPFTWQDPGPSAARAFYRVRLEP